MFHKHIKRCFQQYRAYMWPTCTLPKQIKVVYLLYVMLFHDNSITFIFHSLPLFFVLAYITANRSLYETTWCLTVATCYLRKSSENLINFQINIFWKCSTIIVSISLPFPYHYFLKTSSCFVEDILQHYLVPVMLNSSITIHSQLFCYHHKSWAKLVAELPRVLLSSSFTISKTEFVL